MMAPRSWLSLRRSFSTSSAWSLHYCRTSINPKDVNFSPPSHFTPKSVIILSTPSQLLPVINSSIKLHQENDLQVVVAGVDSVVPNSARNGVSELWLDQTIDIHQSVRLEERDTPKRSEGKHGVHLGTAKENWKHIQSGFEISLNRSTNVNLTLANTIFQTQNLVTLFYFQPSALAGGHPNAGHTLCDLAISLPEDAVALGSRKSFDKWTPLYDESPEPFVISKCTGNLVKEINKKPAAKFLENNDKLMSIGSKDTQVYIKLYKPGQSVPQRFEVIAGGGGWGAKANMLAISPDAKLAVGDRVEFFMLTPTDRYAKPSTSITPAGTGNAVIFECCYEDVSYNDIVGGDGAATVSENVFGCGCEKGFRLDDIKYASAGESLAISI